MSLIATIRACLANINPTDSVPELYSGIIFNVAGQDEFNTLVNNFMANSDPLDILLAHYLVKELGWKNQTAIQYALDNIPASNFVPGTYLWTDNFYYWLMYDTFAAIVYEYAQFYNYDTAKWNAQAAYNEFKANSDLTGSTLATSGGVLWCGGGPYKNYVISYGPRTYDETLETARNFMEFYVRYGIQEGLTSAQTLAQYAANNMYQNGTFQYALQWAGYECETPNIWVVLSKLNALLGYGTEYEALINSDAWTKFLVNGYSSPLWASYYCDHYTGYGTPRLANTCSLAISLQAMFDWLDTQSQTTFQNMLLGANGLERWFTGLTNTALPETLFYSNNEFKWLYVDDNQGVPDATACGLIILMMQGIIPGTSHLLVPLTNEMTYESWYHLRTDIFQMDTTANTLRIIASAGTMQFYFGTAPVSVTFPSDGVYTINFDQGWNNVIGSPVMVSAVPSDLYASKVAANVPPPVVYYVLTVEAATGGTTDPAAGTTNIEANTSTTVTATPSNGYVFSYWILDGVQQNGSTSTITIDMSANHTVQPVFTSTSTTNYVLTTNASPQTGGKVTPLSATYTAGTTVTITATPNPGYTLLGWFIDGIKYSEPSPITITMNANHTVVASFTTSSGGGGTSNNSWVLPAAILAGATVIGVGIYAGTKK